MATRTRAAARGLVACALACALGAPLAQAEEREVRLEGGARLAYLPPLAGAGPAPLVVFVAHSAWGLQSERTPQVEPVFVSPLRGQGVAVAVLEHRPAPSDEPAQLAGDVAAGIDWLLDRAGELGIDPGRVVLSGHGSGGQLAALVALDSSHLDAHGRAPSELAGVLPLCAYYDLREHGSLLPELFGVVARAYPSAAARHAASPAGHLAADAPTFIALVAEDDVPGLPRAAHAMAGALRGVGHPQAEAFVAGGRDHYSIVDMSDPDNAARGHLLALLGVGPDVEATRELWRSRETWRAPALTTLGFWEYADLVKSYEPGPELDAWLARYFERVGGGAAGQVTAVWHAVPLEAWLERAGAQRTGTGRWLIVTNVQGERAVLDLDALREFEPVLVIGVGEERNLFRIVDLYERLRRNTWEQPDAERWLLARPLGAFVYFLKPAPASAIGSPVGLFGLTPESFRRTRRDPLRPVRRRAGDALAELLIADAACVACHGFAGTGGKARHLRARDAQPVGGRALDLEAYPAEVWRRFVHEQGAVAAELGAAPVRIPASLRDALYRLVAPGDG